MSFITKRERVFNEYDLFDLPARNEGKLKAYSSCTDARAWSHFCSDKTEHLVEIIKRNNETVRPKYIPTDVIVNTLMTSKNAEIARLKRKIEEFEQMLAAYDDLDLTCDQKCEIANAHAAIKAANKELDDMFLDLNISGFTEGIDSEAFETGKSRGDEPSRYTVETGKSRGDEWTMGKFSTPRTQTKGNQIGNTCKCDASTSAHDKRIEELRDTIISKDAKLSAMQNTIAVMENDVCEPYCIYAHIYTALEKIFGTLCQNEKYKQYLDLLTAGRDTRGIDLKGKILFKMKILEKFSLALIAPCSQNSHSVNQDCSCYRAEIVTHVETTFALTSAESKVPSLDNKRAQLVADIMQNEDMKEILSKDSLSIKLEDEQVDDCYTIENYDIEAQNLKRLKNLQASYEELLNYYDNLKHERDLLNVRCQKYAEMEKECECLQNKLREYNQLWKEKEYYRKRSEDLDKLKENYYVLSEETANIETKLQAEKEINKIKSSTVDELKNENIKLENKISEISVSFEKQRNILICKLKECECKMMCQEQQIKSLTDQVDSILRGDSNKISQDEDEATRSIELIEEINSQTEQIQNLKNALCCTEEEKQYFQEELDKKIGIINELDLEIENWKRKYEESNDYIENYLEKYQMEISQLQDSNKTAVENLNFIIQTKSQEINNLINEVDRTNFENQNLVQQVKSIQDDFQNKIYSFENEKKDALNSIHSARRQSLETLQSIKSYDGKNENVIKRDYDDSLTINSQKQRDVNNSREQLQSVHSDNVKILTEVQLLREINQETVNLLQNENFQLKRTFDVANKEIEKLKKEILEQEAIVEKFKTLSESHEYLLNENQKLRTDLNNKTFELDNILHAYQVSKKESETLVDQLHKSESIHGEYIKLNEAYQIVISDRNILQNKLLQAENQLKELEKSQKVLTDDNAVLHLKVDKYLSLENILSEVKEYNNKLKETNSILKNECFEKNTEINDLYKKIQDISKENRDFGVKVNELKNLNCEANNKIDFLKSENTNMQLKLNNLKEELSNLKQKLNQFEHLQYNFNELASAHEKLKLEKENLQKDLHKQIENVKKLEQENYNLNNESKTLLMHSEDLEKALLRARNENLTQTDSVHDYYNHIKNEIDALRKEKMSCHKKIGDLLNKLDELEFLRSNLEEMIISKDKKISTLENHINELEDEIRRLQDCLNEVIETGEQSNRRNYDKSDQSLKTIEAHHSKATHNMKIEIAKLQNKNADLENQLFTTKLLTDEPYSKENINLIQITNLQKERLEIISQIKNLEINSIGDSNLSPNDCALENIITSLERIKQFIDEKNKYLENTLINVKASYELLKSKADEAKKIAEEERQKIINEKGELHKRRKNLEDQIENLRKENLNYEISIRDLQGEIMNQTLVLNRVKELSDMDIKRLKQENLSLQDLYDNSLNAMKELQEKIDTESKEKNNCLNEIEKLKITIKAKCEENLNVTKYVESIKNKSYQDFSNQTIFISSSKDIESQTENDRILDVNRINTLECDVTNTSKSLKLIQEQDNIKYLEYLLSKNEQLTMDFLKKYYINEKLKKLNLGKLEHYSIADIADIADISSKNKKTQISLNSNSPVFIHYNSSTHRGNVLASFTQVTNSNKNTTDNESCLSKHQTKCLKSSTIIDTDNNNEPFYTDNKKNDSMSSTDKDMFLIYKESESAYDDKSNIENKSWPQTGLKNMIVERAIIYTNEEPLNKIQNLNTQSDYEGNDDDSLKPQLKINLPRVFTEVSNKTSSDEDIKSLYSYNETTYDSTKWEVYSDTKISSNFSKRHKTPSLASTISNMKNNDDNIVSKQRQEINHLDSDQHSSINMNFNNNCAHNILKSRTESINNTNSSVNLSRTNANFEILQNINQSDTKESTYDKKHFAINYMLNTIQNGIKINNTQNLGTNKTLRRNHSEQKFLELNSKSIQSKPSSTFHILRSENISMDFSATPTKTDRSILVKMDPLDDYELKIKQLTDALQSIERDYKNKMEAIKVQYENNVKHIVNEHNQGVENIQYLHEETVREIINKHENEIENLRTLSIEAMRKAEKLENENFCLKSKLLNGDNNLSLDETPVKVLPSETKKRKTKTRPENKILTKTIVDAFNVKPKKRSLGPCTCSIDINVSDTIRNIFEQVDVEQRQMAELAYLKYIATKILNDNVEELDAQELSFLHLKVCRTWKTKLNIKESFQKRIDSLESELLNKQRQTQKNMADLDRKVAEEWQRLQEVRESVCKGNPEPTRDSSLAPLFNTAVAEKDVCFCNPEGCNIAVEGRHSAEELGPKQFYGIKAKRSKLESNRAVLAKLDTDQRREKKQVFSDETPTRLKRSQDRQYTRLVKK